MDKIRNEIREYTKAKRNLLRIREDGQNGKKQQQGKVRTMRVVTEVGDWKLELGGKLEEKRKNQEKLRTEVNEEHENEEFLYEMLKKNPS